MEGERKVDLSVSDWFTRPVDPIRIVRFPCGLLAIEWDRDPQTISGASYPSFT